jgi:hypothetical protein
MSSRLEELKSRRAQLNQETKKINSNMDMIIEETNRVAEVARDASMIIENIEKEFENKTGLNKTDVTFLFFAVALQCIRQYAFTSFKERQGHEQSAKRSKSMEKKIFTLFDKDSQSGINTDYYASLETIILKGVPYDAQDGSKKFDLGGENKGLSGRTHRFRTLGHDPILGWIFGTANIMTSTLTDWKFTSYHVKDKSIANGTIRFGIDEIASTEMALMKSFERLQEEPEAFAAALIKQALHYDSDLYSTMGLPIPAVGTLTSPDFAQKLSTYGLDSGNLVTVGKQITGAVLINTVIAMVHRLFYNEKVHGSEKLYEVKTRKILSYSNMIASASNIIYVAIDNSAIDKLDIGGIIVTIHRLLTDIDFIRKVKEEFVFGNFERLIQGEPNNFEGV